MRFERTESFNRDYKRLSEGDRRLFIEAVRDFNAACDLYITDPSLFRWPASLRVKSVEATQGIWEMTWSFSGPDGRATFEWCQVEVVHAGRASKLPAVRWRRVGDHRNFRSAVAAA